MSKKVKYSISISLVVFIMALGVITLIMALVPVGSNDAINLPNDVYIYTNLRGTEADKEKGKIELHRRNGTGKDAEKINEIFNLFNEGFRQQKALTALFNGEMGKGLEFVDNYALNKTPSIDKYKDDDEHITLVFCYNDPQPVKNAPSGYKGYEYVCFTVTNSDKLQDIMIGLPSSLNSDDSESSRPNIGFQYSFNGKMSTRGLYKYVYSLLEVHKTN